MQELIVNIAPNLASKLPDFYKALGDTMLMVLWSGLISFVFGLLLGVVLTVTKPNGILENKVVYQILDKLVSLFRSIPFIILLTWVMPITRALVGTVLYVRGAIVPLVFGSVPFFTRQVESALAELDGGLIEAALSMGSSPLEIIFRVYLKESIAAIARGTTITIVSLLNLTAMAGVAGAGGLGDFAIRYGHDRNMADITNVTVLVLVLTSASSNLSVDASSKRTRINVIPIQSLPTTLQKIFLTEDISMKLKKFFALALAATTLALALTACGSKADDSADNSDANTDNQTGETVTVKLGVVGGIYDDLWASAKAALADEGIDLEIVQFSDYVTPNNALANGDIDLNAFQHRIYLQNEIDNYGYAIQNIGNTFIIPLNLYSQKVSSVDELKDGDVVAIPYDLTNGGRALKVLEAAGLIELDPNAAFNPTVDDITSYKVNITIEELKANTIPSVLPDVAAAVVNGNYALDFGLKTDEAIYKDSVLDVEEYWNLIAARTADVEDPDTAAIYETVVEAFQSSATEDVFNNTFGGYFIAVGWDQDLINQ